MVGFWGMGLETRFQYSWPHTNYKGELELLLLPPKCCVTTTPSVSFSWIGGFFFFFFSSIIILWESLCTFGSSLMEMTSCSAWLSWHMRKDLLEKLAHATVGTEKPHNKPSASWRAREAGTWLSSSPKIWDPGNPNYLLEAKRPRTWSSDIQRRKTGLSHWEEREQICLFSDLIFSSTSVSGWGYCLHSAHGVECPSLQRLLWRHTRE